MYTNDMYTKVIKACAHPTVLNRPVSERVLEDFFRARVPPADSGYTSLTAAIRYGSMGALVSEISHGAKVNQREATGATPLMLAAHLNRTSTAEFLLTHGADPNMGDSYDTPLTVAVRKGHVDLIKLLLKHKAKIDVTTVDGMSPVFWSIEEGKTDILKLLVSRGIPATLRNKRGDSPLVLALKRRSCKEIIQALMANGGEMVTPALAWAASDGQLEHMKMLLENGADGDVITADGNTVLAIAVRCRKFDSVKLLTDHQANVCKFGEQGIPPLLWAVRNKDFDQVKWLVEHGAVSLIRGVFGDAIKTKSVDIVRFLYNSYNKAGKGSKIDLVPALRAAVDVGSCSVAKFFLDSGAEFASLANKETMYLIKNIERKNHRLVELFIENGARLNGLHANHTPLSKAVAIEDLKMAQNLVLHGADVNCFNGQRLTPLGIAARARNFELFEFLVQSGANIEYIESSLKHDADLSHCYRTAKEKMAKKEQACSECVPDQDAEAVTESAEAITQDADAITQDADAITQDADAINQDADAIKQDAEAIDQDAEVIDYAEEVRDDEDEFVVVSMDELCTES